MEAAGHGPVHPRAAMGLERSGAGAQWPRVVSVGPGLGCPRTLLQASWGGHGSWDVGKLCHQGTHTVFRGASRLLVVSSWGAGLATVHLTC